MAAPSVTWLLFPAVVLPPALKALVTNATRREGHVTEEKKQQDGAHEPECKHVQKATYVQMTLL